MGAKSLRKDKFEETVKDKEDVNKVNVRDVCDDTVETKTAENIIDQDVEERTSRNKWAKDEKDSDERSATSTKLITGKVKDEEIEVDLEESKRENLIKRSESEDIKISCVSPKL